MPDDPVVFQITRRIDSLAPLELHGAALQLFVLQNIRVVNDHCQTESYSYRIQESDDRASWLVRWEYFRKPPRDDYPYPLAHVHLKAVLSDGAPTGRFHFPTGRVTLEAVLWHLIAEWGVVPKSDDWQDILTQSIEGFLERRRAH